MWIEWNIYPGDDPFNHNHGVVDVWADAMQKKKLYHMYSLGVVNYVMSILMKG